MLEGPRLDEGWQRACGDARLAPHLDARRVDVVDLDVVQETAARLAQRGDALWGRAASDEVTVSLLADSHQTSLEGGSVRGKSVRCSSVFQGCDTLVT